MCEMGDALARKILEWAYETLSSIDAAELTEFERQLLDRLKDDKP